TVYRGAGQGGLTRVWVPDFILQHASGKAVQLEIMGFWRKTSLNEILEWVPQIKGIEPLWAVSEKWRVDENTAMANSGRVVTFRDIPNATDILMAATEIISG
ncbi:MAG: DUF790 family protein, partial [Isosphaeraceae bacterium]